MTPTDRVGVMASDEDLTSAESELDEARAALRRLAEDVQDALAVLGTGPCPELSCDGCEHERQEAVRILRTALERELAG